jgi:hypothetical protein
MCPPKWSLQDTQLEILYVTPKQQNGGHSKMDPTAVIVASQSCSDHARSALPNAPVVRTRTGRQRWFSLRG